MHRTIRYIAPLAIASAIGCGGSSPESADVNETTQATTACPTPDSQDAQERAAATAALSILMAASKTGTMAAPQFTNTALAAQRYTTNGSGGIEFDPSDPLYKYVSPQMNAALAFAQLDTTVAAFLANGLAYAHANSSGEYFPSISSVAALANFTYPGPSASVHIPDTTSANNSHQASASGSQWCGSEMLTLNETVSQSYSYSPLYAVQITNPGVYGVGGWINSPPAAFKGTSSRPMTPFNGPLSSGNPYLVVSVNGAATNWANYNFSPVSCWANSPSFSCTGQLQLDPVPYAEPGAYYDSTGTLVGTQANPFQLVSTVLYSTPDHASQWATRTVSGVQEWGTFSTATTLLGVTEYKYVKQM